MKIVKKNKTYFMNLNSKDNLSLIDQLLDIDFEVIKLNDDVFSLVRKSSSFNGSASKVYGNSNNSVGDSKSTLPTNIKKIYNLLNDKNLPINNKVEGMFEKLLNDKELKIFKELLDSKKIAVFKLSEKYKKGIYKVNDSFNQNNPKDQNIDFSEFDRNKWIILPNKFGVAFSKVYKEQLESKDIIGLKSFDSNYYIIDSTLYEDIKEKLIDLNIKDSFEIPFIESKLSLHKDLIRIVLEILNRHRTTSEYH